MNKVESALSRTTDTKALVIGTETLPQVADMFRKLFPDKRALVVADANTWRVAGDDVHKILAGAGVAQDEPYVFTDPKLYAEWAYVGELDTVLSETDAVPVAVGSGVIHDLTKLCSSHNGRRYMVVGTAASMDGYTAYGASITKDGNKQTFDCPAPLGMVLDPNIAAAAPAKLSASGYADLIAKIPAGADWMLSDAVGSEPMDDFAFGLVQDGLKEALSDPAGVHAGNVEKVEQLAEGLLLSGFAMQATQSSRPASGAEHQFSHLWDMEHLKYNGASVSHGFKVGIGTLASTAFLEMLLDARVEQLDIERCVAAWKSWDETERDIRAIFNDDPEFVARGLKETRDKYVDREGLRDQLTRLKKAWPELRERIRRQIIPFDEVRRRLELVGAPYEPEQIGVSRTRFREAFGKIPYMRSRYTVIDTAFRCGWMEEWLDRLFGKGGGSMLEVQLNLMEKDGNINILSSPSITTLDNKMAYTENGEKVPYVSTSNMGDREVKFEDAVLRLEMTPNVIDGDNLKLKVLVKKDEVDTSRSVDGNPFIIKKQTETTLIMRNGETVVISGLTKEKGTDINAGVPGLKDIPGGKYVFGHESKGKTMEEVLIFITPEILPTRELPPLPSAPSMSESPSLRNGALPAPSAGAARR